MDIHEYQAKGLLKRFGIPVPRGGVARDPAQAEAVARELRGSALMVKAQILAGGRGKAGGVRLARSIAEAKVAAARLIGTRLATEQTGAEGMAVKSVYIEERIDSLRELYLAAAVDRGAGRIVLLGSAAGGEEVERTAAREPDRLRRLAVDPEAGLDRAAARAFAEGLGLDGATADLGAAIMVDLCRAFVALDASLIEINPLALVDKEALIAVDAKMSLDDNALFRHPELAALHDPAEADPTEAEAARYELNYVRLDGDIGCMVNGAGLALATLDLIHGAGGRPANFMDVRPVATRQQIATGFKLIVGNPKVKAILVNVYGGGILRCDTVAEGIAAAVREAGLGVPLIVRLAGTNAEIARKALTGQRIPATFAGGLAEAAEAAVEAARAGAA